MRFRRLSVFSILTVAALTGLTMPLAPPWDDIHVKHAWNAAPVNWESLGHPPLGTTIDLYVALKPQNESALIDALYEVSTPEHPRYGAHLSKEEVAKLVAPHPDALELVHSWLAHHGVEPSSISRTDCGSWLTLSGVPVSQANQLLGASYQLYRHAGTNATAILRTVGYALPMVLHAHVQTVAPTTFFAFPRTARQTPREHSAGAAGAPPDSEKAAPREFVTELSSRDEPDPVTPEFLRWLYKTLAYIPIAAEKNSLGIVGYNNLFPSHTDLTLFMDMFRTDADAATFTLELVNDGGYDPSHPGVEANLDTQYAQAIAYPTPQVFYSTGGQIRWSGGGLPSQDDALLVLLVYMLSLPDNGIPQTISTSYGVDEKLIPPDYATAVCFLFSQLGLRGVSVLISSGDDGVGPGDCKVNHNDGSKRVQFSPAFPASCPWVTSVGGTTSSLPEIAASLSGGGFSDYFLRPRYQHGAVSTFLQHLGRKHDGLYNPIGRGVPDISAQALNFMIALNTNPRPVSGTSCAAPTVAGIISLLNDFLISNGKPPLGFLNPWLYGSGLAGLNDVTSGSNPGCGTEGFSAITGWDPVTGLGTPDFFILQYILYRGMGKQGRTFSEILNNSDTLASGKTHF